MVKSMALLVLPIEKIEPLKKGDYVHFSENWKPSDFAGKYFLVTATMRKIFDRHFIIPAGSSYDFTIDEDTGLLPTSIESLYEIFVGIKGLILAYIKWPTSDYLVRLEKTGYMPDVTDDVKRYIGIIEPADTPPTNPKLVLYTTKSMDPIALSFYNDTEEDQKIVIRFAINHCKLEEAPAPGAGAVVREIQHWRDIRAAGL